jgi:DNA modification methylase
MAEGSGLMEAMKEKKPRKPKGKAETLILGQHIEEDFAVYHGDNVEVIRGMPDDSVGLVVTSPPFPSMYVYNNTARDIGNTKGIEEMLAHFRFLAGRDGLFRVVKPGRSICIHLTQVPVFQHQDGFVGRRDFRGGIIQLMIEEGWIYHSEVLIDKCPQIKAARTNDRGLLFKSLATDSSVMAPCMADYILVFRKPGINPEPIRAGRSVKYKNPDGWITQDEWIEWAAAAWYRRTKDYPGGISETDVLNVKVARTADDERHLCPLQLGVIERCVKLWSNPGDIVLDPFSGVGSTGYRAVQLHRKYVGIELKGSYFKQSIRYIRQALDKVPEASR